MAEVYDKMENERNQLLDELDVAFQDLQEYMHRHVSVNSVLISSLFFDSLRPFSALMYCANCAQKLKKISCKKMMT